MYRHLHTDVIASHETVAHPLAVPTISIHNWAKVRQINTLIAGYSQHLLGNSVFSLVCCLMCTLVGTLVSRHKSKNTRNSVNEHLL